MQSSGAPHLTAEEVTGRRRRGGGDGEEATGEEVMAEEVTAEDV